MRVGSLFTGYGGIELGLRAAGVEVDLRWFAETDVVSRVMGDAAPNLGDVRKVDWSAVEPVELVTAGFPCQPVSAAGRQRGELDERWLWPAVAEALDWLRPRFVLIENVSNLASTQDGALWQGICDDLLTYGYAVRWTILGACHVGAAHHRHRLIALAEHGTGAGIRRVPGPPCNVRSVKMLPTPTAREGDRHGRGEGGEYYWRQRAESGRTNGMPLGAAVRLLPTPRAGDAIFGASYHNNRGEPGAITSAVQPEHWGRFAVAVARHEAMHGPAPAPTEPNRNGAPRLAAAFAEWLMCLPAGHVTSVLGRTPALKAIGNGVCPPQLAAAWRLLTSGAA